MKIFTLLHNSNIVGTVLPGLKSRITSTRPVLALLLLLMVGGWNSVVWAQLPYNTTMTSSHYSNSSIVVGKDDARYSHNGWDGGIKLEAGGVRQKLFGGYAETGTEWNWDDKYVIIALKTNSIPYQLKFKYKCSSNIATNPDWYVAESTSKNGPWTNVWSTSSKNTSWSSEQTVNLSKSTKYIKLCYSGNYAGTFGSIKVTDQAYVHNPTAGENEITSLPFGSGTISSGKAELSFDVEWCNVDALSVASSNSTYFTVSPASFGSKANYGTQTVKVYYDRDVEVGDHSGTITISNGNATYTKTVSVSGTTTLRPQAIHWDADLAAVNYTLNAEDNLTGSAIATADNEEATITYTSSNSDVIAVSLDGKTLVAVANGTAKITATATGNDIYDVGTDSKTFTVTAKKKQTITWEQTLVGLKTNASPNKINLNATATSGGTVTYAIETGSDACITLSGANNSVMTITGTPGEAYIIATQAGGIIGGEEWISATARKQVKVRDPNSACDEYALADQSFTFNKGDKTSMSEKAFNLTGKPTTLTFYAKRGGLKYLWSEQQDMYVEQYANFGSGLEWKQVVSIKPGEDRGKFGPYTLDETATKIRFRSGEYAEQNVTNISVPRKKELEVSETDITENAERNVRWSKTISVSRSNIDVVDLSVTSSDASCPFVLNKTSIGTDCADRSTETFEVSFTPKEKNKTYTGTITITDGKANPTIRTINLSVTTVAFNQAITWNFEDNQVFETTHESLVFDATTDATGLSVSYKLKDGDEDKATIEGNTLTFTASGTIHVIAYQEGSDRYNAAPEIEKTIIVNKVTPAIATNPKVATIKYLDNLTNGEGCQLSEGLATVTLRGVENTEVVGTFTWTNAGQVTDAAGSHDYQITFTPTDGGMYSSKTFTQSVTISRADGGIEMNDGEVKVKVAGINDDLPECSLDLNSLIQSKVEDAGHAGNVTYEVTSENNGNASIVNGVFSATTVGTYTIVATQAQTDYYEQATDEFTVTVKKLKPVIVFDNSDPEIIYSRDVIKKPAYRSYNKREIDRNVHYSSNVDNLTGAIYVNGTTLEARDVAKKEGEAARVVITASSDEDALYEAAENTTHNYDVRAKRSPHFTMDGQTDAPVSKTLHIGETATITYNENTNEQLAIGTAAELNYVTYTHDAEARTITVTAQKGALVGDGVQTITLNQPGSDFLFPRTVVYTFTVERNVSALSLEGLTSTMNVEDTVATPFTGLANTAEAVLFSCSPEGSMKYEDGKLIALQAGTNTVTFYQLNTEYWTGISQNKTITVSPKDPVVSTELNNRHAWYSIIEHPFVSESSMPMTITSSNEGLAKYIAAEDKIYVYGTSGYVTFTMTQEANYKYNAVNYEKMVEIFQPNNRLPMTLTSGNLTDYNGGSGRGGAKWSSGGVECGSNNGFDWDDKYIILSFVGIPDKLSFDFETSSWAATEVDWYFQQSANGTNWETLKTYDSQIVGGTPSGSENFQLKPSTRFVKLCYSGNFNGRFKNVKITERKEIVPKSETTDFGLGYNGNDPTARTIKVDWYNVEECTVSISGTDASRFEIAEGSNVINSLLDNYGTAELVVRYKHDVNTATQHTATLHIESADGKTADITLKGQTTPAPQDIIWRNDLTPMPVNGVFESAAMVGSGLKLSLVSDDESIVRVEEGTTLVGVNAGTVRVTATAEGNDKWAESSSYIDIEVTTKNVQYITWNDKLSNLKCEDGQTVNITLTATSSSSLQITYELDEDAQTFASVEGNTLRLTGWGSGTIIAHQLGNDDYVAVQKEMTLVSRNPSAGCNPLVGEYKSAYTLHTIAEKQISLSGEPGTIEFDAKCDGSALYGLWVAEYDGEYWHDGEAVYISRLGDNSLTSSYSHFGPLQLHRNTTSVKLFTQTGATMTRTFKNVKVTLAKYLELAENNMNFSQVDKGSNKTQSFYINYSNLTGVLDVELETESTQFEVLTTTVGEDCGDVGKYVRIDIRFTGSELGTEDNKIIISNKDQRLEIPVSATVVLPSQTITWEPETNIWTTDHVILSATATSELPVSFTSGNTDIADVVYEGGVYSLAIKKYGDVAITAHQSGNENWSAATDKTLTFHISRVTPTITSYPTATGVILPITLAGSTLEGGVADVEGSFVWQDASQAVIRGTVNYSAQFVPTNTNYYNIVPFEIAVPLLLTPQTITWNRSDEAEEWCTTEIALNAIASSGLTITYHSSDSTVAYAEDDHLHVLKYGPVTITAVQAGNETYDAAEPVSKTITFKRAKLTLTEPTVSGVYVHHFLSNSTFTGGGAMAGSIVVDGMFSWQEPGKLMDIPGVCNNIAVFTPFNANIYEPKTCTLSVEVLRFAPQVTHDFTAEAADYGIKTSELILNGSGTAIDQYDPAHPLISGEFVWKTPTHVPLLNETTATLVFRPTRSEWYDEVELPIGITINPVGYIFTGNGDWETSSNWALEEVPDGPQDVVIQGNVTISSEVVVNKLTIDGGGNINIALSGTLTVQGVSGERDMYGDLHIYENGKMVLGKYAQLNVNDFTLDAALGNTSSSSTSGQVLNEEKLDVTGDAYFQLAVDPSGRNTLGWYDFVVPFEVDVIGGITMAGDNTPMQYNVNYLVMDYNETKRAVNGKSWNRFSGTMEAGRVYTITLDETNPNWNTVVFKKKAGAPLTGDRSFTTEYSGLGEAKDNGWNGFGNGTLHHTELDVEEGTLIQLYDHTNRCYNGHEAKDNSIAVGMSFFMQVDGVQTITLDTADNNNSSFLAPARTRKSVDKFRLSLTAEGQNNASDHLWVSANEEATGEYVIGRDVLKMGTMTESKVARLWSERNGIKLCSNEMPMTANKANCAISLYAAEAGIYSLAVENEPEDATLYLTKNGKVIWNLSMSPYEFDLTQGTTEGYGLRIVANSNSATDIEGADSEGETIRKVLIDDMIYIIAPNGSMYNVNGKIVK